MGVNLTDLYIDESFQRLVQIDGQDISDGTGSAITNLNITVPTSVSSSFATTASFALNSTPQVSSSYALSASQAENSNTATLADTASFVEYVNVANKPTLVSGSSQIILQDTTGDLSGSRINGTVSLATSASYALNADNSISSSYSVTATSSSYANTSTSASHALVADTSISSSYALTASYALNSVPQVSASYATSASHALNADNSISSSYAVSATSASFANVSISSSYANIADTSISSSYALTASYAFNSVPQVSASYATSASQAENANTSTTASYALTSADAGNWDGIYTGSAIISGGLTVQGDSTVNQDPLGAFSEVDMFSMAPVDDGFGNTYDVAHIFRQNYQGGSQAYANAYATEFWDSYGYNYGNEYVMSPQRTSWNLYTPEGKYAQMFLRNRYTGTEFDGTTQLFLGAQEFLISANGDQQNAINVTYTNPSGSTALSSSVANFTLGQLFGDSTQTSVDFNANNINFGLYDLYSGGGDAQISFGNIYHTKNISFGAASASFSLDTDLYVSSGIGTPGNITANTFIGNSANISGSATIGGTLTVTDLLQADYLATANYADDTAAAAGGIPVNGIYRSGNVLMVRLT
jgi:hypothetical protein